MNTTQNTETKMPKVFISYSWTSPEHQQWVIRLAEQLHDANIHPIFDQWDLRPGQDSVAFMESMVNDSSIDKIIMIIDDVYTERANARSGGVGSESTILSNELYNVKDTDNILAIISEPGAKPPIFYSARIYIDLSTEEKYAENYESLIRWIYDQFKHERPKRIGSIPSFITSNENSAVLFTNTEYHFALDAIEKGGSTAGGRIKAYLNKLKSELVKISIDSSADQTSSFIENFAIFQKHLKEFTAIANSVCELNPDPKLIKHFMRFLESLLSYATIPFNQSRTIADSELYGLIIYQIFLNFVAVIIKNEEFELLKIVLEEIYSTPTNHPKFNHFGRYSYFRIFYPFEQKFISQNINSSAREPISKIIQDNHDDSIVSFDEMCEADFILYLKSVTLILNDKAMDYIWWPSCAINLNQTRTPVKIFAKSENKDYLLKVLAFFSRNDMSFIEDLLKTKGQPSLDSIVIPNWRMIGSLNIEALTNYQKLKS